MTRPFVPLEVAWWPAIAERLQATGEPWPAEAVCVDLRWWADQERMGQTRRPGRPTLAARWGWTDRKARAILADAERWSDPFQRPAGVQSASRPRPAEGQPAPRETRPRRDPGSSPGPVQVQPPSSERPRARVDTPTGHLDTDTRGDTPRPPAASALSDSPGGDPEGRARAIWDEEYARSSWGSAAYPWDLGRRGADHRRLRRWQAVGGSGSAGEVRLRGAVRAYLAAVTTGQSWPRGDPPTTQRFTDEIAKWIQLGEAPMLPLRTATRGSRAGPDRPLSIAERAAARRVPVQAEAPEIFTHPLPRSEA